MKAFCCILFYVFWLVQKSSCLHFFHSPPCDTHVISNEAGVIYRNADHTTFECWRIVVPGNKYLRLSIEDFDFRDQDCNDVYLKIDSGPTKFKFCLSNRQSFHEDLLFLSDVHIEAALQPRYRGYDNVYFNISYSLESIECAHENSFRCSKHKCVDQNKVCNGIKDCENELDEDGCAKGVAAVSGVNSSRVEAAGALKNRRSTHFGWGDDTHRAILALFLSGDAHFNDNNELEELMKKELEMKFLLALLRNSTDLLPITELGIFVNALTVTCHNTRQFYGHDLLQILGNRVVNSATPVPGASLALCNSNWTLPESTVRSLLRILEKDSEYPFIQDIQAMSVMALTCIQRKTSALENIENASDAYNAMIENLISSQNPDGSFGNVYTTAIITQALLSSGQDTNPRWNVTSTVKYLMQEVKNSTNLLTSYLVVPVLNNKTLLSVSNAHCSKSHTFTGNGASDLANKLGRKVHVQYSLYIGDHKDVVHTIFLRVPEKSTAYDVMQIATANDAKYKFSYRYFGQNLYVYSIAGVFNDPESLKFWLLYTTDSNRELVHFRKSPDTLIVRNKQHLIMWFKTVPALEDGTVETQQPEPITEAGSGEVEISIDNQTRNLVLEDGNTEDKVGDLKDKKMNFIKFFDFKE